jgi:hypothetical protein
MGSGDLLKRSLRANGDRSSFGDKLPFVKTIRRNW